MLKYALFCPIFQNEKCLILLIIRHLRNFAFHFSGAGGDRTRVQTRNKGAFYMFILLLIVGTKSGNRHPNRILISFILLARQSFGKAIPVFVATPWPKRNRTVQSRDISSQYLVPGLSIIYFIRLRSKSIVICAL